MTAPAPAAAPAVPQSVLADGAVRAVWVPALANVLAPTLAELNAAAAVDLSCYLTPTGFAPSTEEAAVDDDRFCSRESFESPGRIKNGLELTYVYDPQNKTPADNRAYTTLRRNTRGFAVVRWGVDFEAAFAAANLVDVYPSICGDQRKMPPEANSTLKVMQKLFIRATVRRDVAVVA